MSESFQESTHHFMKYPVYHGKHLLKKDFSNLQMRQYTQIILKELESLDENDGIQNCKC